MESFLIREVVNDHTTADSVDIIREAFRKIARDFKLTPENCATNPAFITCEEFKLYRQKGIRFFGIFILEKQIGLIGIESNSNGIYFLEKLAVLPEYRNKGYGAQLVKFALNFARNDGAKKASLGTIHDHIVLKEWYKKLGFKETVVKKVSSLPFLVSFMEIDLSK